MWDKFRTGIGVLLITVGIGLIGVTVLMKYDTYRQQKAISESFTNLDKSFNIDTMNEEIKEEKNEEDSNSYNTIGIALLKIPKIDLEIGIVEGVDVEDIKYVAGHFPGTAMPGKEGNFCFAGHRQSNFGQPFKKVDKLENGDELIVIYKGEEYIYEVTDSFTVTPKDTYVLQDTPNEYTMTLVTCTLDSKNRFIIKGKLKY